MQRNAQSRILNRVARGFVNLYLRKGNLAHAFATHVFIRQTGDVHIARGNRIQTMLRRGVEHIGFEQRVVYHAVERNAVIGKHMAVVFQMLADFVLIGIFQPRLEFRQNGIQIQLRHRLHALMRHRHVPTRIARDRK